MGKGQPRYPPSARLSANTVSLTRYRQALRKCPSLHPFLTFSECVSNKHQITHSEWGSSDAFSASAGSGLSKSSTDGTPFKRLPFNFCAVSLQPFHTPVCAPDGTIFDIDHILPWLLKQGTNPVNGETLKSADLLKLNFARNDDGEMVDPVTYKVFTNNTHIVALANTGNVFAWETVERLNIKAKMWRDLVSDAEFSRKDIITLQDPQNLSGRNLSAFKYLKEGTARSPPRSSANATTPAATSTDPRSATAPKSSPNPGKPPLSPPPPPNPLPPSPRSLSPPPPRPPPPPHPHPHPHPPPHTPPAAPPPLSPPRASPPTQPPPPTSPSSPTKPTCSTPGASPSPATAPCAPHWAPSPSPSTPSSPPSRSGTS